MTLRQTRMVLVSAWLASFGAGPAACAAEPAKDAGKRRGYDFTQPEPADILPNPPTGAGASPALREYVTTHSMSQEGGQGSAAPPPDAAPTGDMGAPPPPAGNPPRDAGSSPPPPAAKRSHERPPKTSPPPPPPESAPPKEAAGSPPSPSVSDYVRTSLAEQVAELGPAGPFTYRPSAVAMGDAALRAREEATWNQVTAALAQSWRSWTVAHPPAPTRMAAPTPPPARAVVQTLPGRLILSGAPASVTGDFPAEADVPAIAPQSP